MTIYAVCSIRDEAAEVYGRPFLAPNRASAVRSFSDELKRPESGTLHQHPEDFTLWLLGVFDDVSGKYDLLASYERLARGQDLIG